MILLAVSWAEKLSAYSTLGGTIVQAAAFVAAAYVLCLTIQQLRSLNHTLKLTALSGLLQLEADMCARKAKLDDISAEAILQQAEKETTDQSKLTYQQKKMQEAREKSLEARKKTAKENWFNAVDRLCFVIRKGYWHGIDWQAEYEAYIRDIFESHRDWFRPELYPNIIAVYEQWKTQRVAQTPVAPAVQ
jgi:hypothetical protein